MFRKYVLLLTAVVLCCCMGCNVSFKEEQATSSSSGKKAPKTAPCEPLYVIAPEDEVFLDDLEHRIFQYFWNEVYPETGIAIDHTENRTGKVAATGFELAAVCVGVKRGWITRDEGCQRALKILKAFWRDPKDPPNTPHVDGHFGLYWHFVDGKTGRFKPLDCVAMCDSADFIAGVVVAGEFFKGTPVEDLARKIYSNVQWNQFVSKRLDGKPGLLSFGWVPKHVSQSYYETDGLLDYNMSGFADNSLLVYILALGSDTFPIPQETWEQYVDSCTLDEYSGYECVSVGQLFCRQVPHSFVRFSRKRDRKIDYFLDTVNALLADRIFNMRVNGYPPQLWGLTDCFGKNTYSHAAPPGPVMNDGTVGPTAFVSALPDVPDLSIEAMRYVREKFGDRAYGRYGFTSSVNLKNNFASPRYVGIELGPMIMMIENYRSGLIWDLFSDSLVMKNFVRRAGMSGVVDDFELPPEAPAYAHWTATGGWVKVGGDEPEHGRKCLEIQPNASRVRITGRLPENDLLEFHYGRYLSLWTRDLQPVRCTLMLDGREVSLAAAGHFTGRGWNHFYYEIPAHKTTSAVCAVTLEAEVRGPRPALDNVTLEAKACLGAPAAIRDLKANTGTVGGTMDLRWTAPMDSGNDPIAKYVVTASDTKEQRGARSIELPPIEPAGAAEERTVLLDSGKHYCLTVTAMNAHGHFGLVSNTAEAQSNSSILNRVAYDFKDDSLKGWRSSDTHWSLRVVSEKNGARSLRVDFEKKGGWDHLIAKVDPLMVSLHRYITLRVKGRVKILGKLWCSGDLQQDMQSEQSDSDTEWTVWKFDTKKAYHIVAGRDRVTQLLLFPQPGEWSGGGTFFIGAMEYAD